MAEKTSGGVLKRLRTWLLSSSFGVVALCVPAIAHAKEHHSYKHSIHHVGHQHLGVDRVSYRHDDHHDRADHVIRADYRTAHHRPTSYHAPRLIHTDYRSDREPSHVWHDRDRSARLLHADYRTVRGDHRYDRHFVPRFSYSRLQCVPYAREVSHIELSGDAFLWWAQAAGRYERGHIPAAGAVLNFRSTGRMPLGHVAVVTAVIDSRKILVTQANWVRGTITNDVTVEDVSPDNNWTAVRVEYGNGSDIGSTYPTYGFIYDHPAYAPTIYAASAAGRNEVAEAPMARPIATEAPNRNLR